MKNKKFAIVLTCLFFVYVVLALFNSLYWTPVYQENALVLSIGAITDGETLEQVWIPGQILSFLFSTMAGEDLTIIGAILTFLIGAFIIMKTFRVSFADLKLLSRKDSNQY